MTKRLHSVLWQDVQFERTVAIPVLVGCGRREADGWLLPAKRQQFVRVVDSSLSQSFKSGSKGKQSADSGLIGLMLLIDALKQRDATVLDLAKQWLWPDPAMRKLLSPLAHLNPVALLGKLLPEGVKDVEFVVWSDTRDDNYTSLQPGLFCPDVQSALYVLTLLYGEGQGACRQCGKLLVRKRSTKQYCNASCRAKWDRAHPERAKKSRKRNRRH